MIDEQSRLAADAGGERTKREVGDAVVEEIFNSSIQQIFPGVGICLSTCNKCYM